MTRAITSCQGRADNPPATPRQDIIRMRRIRATGLPTRGTASARIAKKRYGRRSRKPNRIESGRIFGVRLTREAINIWGRNQPALTMAGIRPMMKGLSVRVAAKTGMMVLIFQKLSAMKKKLMSSVLTMTLCRKFRATDDGTLSSGRMRNKLERR